MPIKMLTIEDLDLDDKRIFLRVDINTPIHPKTGELIEQTRIEEAAITIRDLMNSRVVVASHQGRVGRSDYVSLRKHAEILSRILGARVKFVEDVFGPSALEAIDNLKKGEVLVLENLRFVAEENYEYTPQDALKTIFVNRLKNHFDACVLDAFSTAHRAPPSIVGFAEIMPTCAGRVVAKELRSLERIFSIEKGPYVTVLGGAKVNDRLEAIEALFLNNRADKILLSGLVGTLFLKAAGKYKKELGIDNEAKLLQRCKELLSDYPDRFELPVDVAIMVDGARKEVSVDELPSSAEIMDIGSKTVARYSRIIRSAGTAFMSGPPGVFELEGFSLGTEGLLKAMATSLGTTIVSGGHLSAALHKFKIHESIDHVSTAGGALVQYLAGKRLPLIDALERAAKKWGVSLKFKE